MKKRIGKLFDRLMWRHFLFYRDYFLVRFFGSWYRLRYPFHIKMYY